MHPYRRTFSSDLNAPAATVWARITSIEGINAELEPFLTMSGPPDGVRLDEGNVPIGKPAFVSRLRLFGVVPMGSAAITLVSLEPGRRFVEQSPMPAMRLWRHDRRVEPTPRGSRLTDELTYAPRLRVMGPIVDLFFRFVFGHRHRELRRAFS